MVKVSLVNTVVRWISYSICGHLKWLLCVNDLSCYITMATFFVGEVDNLFNQVKSFRVYFNAQNPICAHTSSCTWLSSFCNFLSCFSGFFFSKVLTIWACLIQDASFVWSALFHGKTLIPLALGLHEWLPVSLCCVSLVTPYIYWILLWKTPMTDVSGWTY